MTRMRSTVHYSFDDLSSVNLLNFEFNFVTFLHRPLPPFRTRRRSTATLSRVQSAIYASAPN
jgi:hypothetical protein